MTLLLRSLSSEDAIPPLDHERVYIRIPRVSDYSTWREIRAESRSFLEPWEPKWSPDSLTRLAYRRRLKRHVRDIRDDRGIAFFIFDRAGGSLLGGVTLSNIRLGVSRSCSLGYWIGERYARQGFMADSVVVIVRYVFDILRLHRLEAACVPSNIPSVGVLRKSGFTEEGLARKYLRINGSWKDHLLFSILSTDRRPPFSQSEELGLVTVISK